MLDFRYKTKIKDIQDRYKFKIFCYDATGTSIADFNANAAQKTEEFNQNAVDKTNEFDEHTESIQAELQEVQEELEGVQTELNSYKTIYNALPKVEGEGTEITLNNTANAIMPLQLDPSELSQETTTGKNQIQNNLTSQTINGITVTVNDDKSVKISGTATAGTTLNIGSFTGVANTNYLLSGCTNGATSSFYLNLQGVENNLNGDTSFTGDGNSHNLRIVITNGASVNTTIYPMIRLATITDNTYEEYTGGLPMPNPQYPSDVHVISGDNSIKVQNKNLANINNISNRTGDPTINITNNTIVLSNVSNPVGAVNVGIKLKELCPNLKVGDVAHVYFDDTSSSVNKNIIYIGEAWTKGSNYSKTITQAMLDANVIVYGGHNETAIISNFMITTSNDSTYEPYQSQVKPLNLGDIEYCKIGTYSDHFFKAIDGDSIYDSLDDTTKESLTDGKWYMFKRLPKNVFNGTESWEIANSGTSSYFYRLALPNRLGTDGTNYLSNLFSNVVISSSNTNEGIYITSSNQLRIRYGEEKTIANWKIWLSTHNTIVYYILATPTYILLNDTLQTQLDDIYNTMLSYQGQTNVSQVNDDLPFEITSTALYDLNNLVPTNQTLSLNMLGNTRLQAAPLNVSNIEPIEETSDEEVEEETEEIEETEE